MAVSGVIAGNVAGVMCVCMDGKSTTAGLVGVCVSVLTVYAKDSALNVEGHRFALISVASLIVRNAEDHRFVPTVVIGVTAKSVAARKSVRNPVLLLCQKTVDYR